MTPALRTAARRLAASTRHDQGLAPVIEDREHLAKLATIVHKTPRALSRAS